MNLQVPAEEVINWSLFDPLKLVQSIGDKLAFATGGGCQSQLVILSQNRARNPERIGVISSGRYSMDFVFGYCKCPVVLGAVELRRINLSGRFSEEQGGEEQFSLILWPFEHRGLKIPYCRVYASMNCFDGVRCDEPIRRDYLLSGLFGLRKTPADLSRVVPNEWFVR
jgi:hypothetical protein